MRFRPLGKTGLKLSAVGLGGHWPTHDGRRYYDRFADDEVPADILRNRREVLSACQDTGINYIDITTGAECLAYGQALAGLRDRFIIGADDYQWSARNPACCNSRALIANVERCLSRLQTDYIDIWRVTAEVHGHNTDEEIAAVIEAANRLRQAGKIRFLGVSSHSRTWICDAIERFDQFEAALVPCTPLTWVTAGPESVPEPFATFARCGIGVMAIKPFAGGLLFQPTRPGSENGNCPDKQIVDLTFRHVLHGGPQISCVLAGMASPAEVHIAASSAAAPPLTPAEQEHLLAQARARLTKLPKEYAWLEQWHDQTQPHFSAT